MAHMRYAATVGKGDTVAMRWGRLVHMAVLEPHRLADLPVWGGGTKRGAAWTEFSEQVGDGEYVTGEERDDLDAMAARAGVELATLPPVVATELAIHWSDPDYGHGWATIDAVTESGGMVEIKTAARIDERLFLSQAYSLGYHLQLGWYDHGLSEGGKRGDRWVLAMESKPPYTTAVYVVPGVICQVGYDEARKIAVRYRECERAGVWPGAYDGRRLEFAFPRWAAEEWTVGETNEEAMI